MFSAIKPTGAFPLSGHTGHTPLTGAGQNKNIAERQHYDQFQRSVQLSDEQQKIQETVSSLSKQARMRWKACRSRFRMGLISLRPQRLPPEC